MSHDIVKLVNSNYHNIQKLQRYISCNGTVITTGNKGDPTPTMRLVDYTRFHGNYPANRYDTQVLTDINNSKNYVELSPQSSTNISLTPKRYLIVADWITNIQSTTSDISFTIGRSNTQDTNLQNSINLANDISFVTKPLPIILNTSPINEVMTALAVHNSSLNTGASNNHMQILDIPPNTDNNGNSWRYYIFFTYLSSNYIFFTNIQLFLYEIL